MIDAISQIELEAKKIAKSGLKGGAATVALRKRIFEIGLEQTAIEMGVRVLVRECAANHKRSKFHIVGK